MPLFRRGSSGRGRRNSEARANGDGGSAAAAGASPAATVATAGFLVTPQSAPTSASTATPSAPVPLAPPLLSAPVAEETLHRRSEQAELAGLVHTNNPSATATVASATILHAPSVLSNGAERATPVSEHRFVAASASSAPSLPPSERHVLLQTQEHPLHHQPQQGATTTPRKAATAHGEENERPPPPASSLEGPIPLPVVVVAPVEQGSAAAIAAVAAQPDTSSSGSNSIAAAVGPLPLASPPVGGMMSPPPAPSSSQPVTPWGEASDEPTKPPSRAAAAPALEPGGASSPGLGKEVTSATAVKAVAAAAPRAQQQPGGDSLPTTTVLTSSALRELGGLRKGPSADREDSISLEERKQRVVEGMRRISRVASEALTVVATDAAAGAAAAAIAAPAPAEEVAEPERDVYVFQGRVKMVRRRWYMLLNAGRGGKVGRRLDFYATRADLEARRPPKESISLSPGCIVESRRLPLPSAGKGLGAVVAGTHTGSGGAPSSSSSSSSSAAATFPGSYSAGATPISMPQGASFSETLEPDSVIDLLIPTSSGGKGLRTLTLQCFSVAEENRWISELQLAIGALHEADDDALLGLGVGRDSGSGERRASRSMDLSRPMAAPQACCVVS